MTGSISYESSRLDLQQVAVHVMARRRFTASGRFGLRATPGGLGTPVHGDDEVVRISGTLLIREFRTAEGVHTRVHPLSGATMAELAAFADVDLDPSFSVGHDTPALTDRDRPLTIDAGHAATIAEAYQLGAQALATVAAEWADATVAQIWPEHFDIALDVAAGSTRANVGVSPGDGYRPEPYAYLGPWSAERPGAADYWNAGFGALITVAELGTGASAGARLRDFWRRGLALLDG
jgi:hypothetical protein